MKQLSMDTLRTFVAIINEGGFAKAGNRLGRSQPAISLQIKKIEEQLGQRLFRKVGQRYEATAVGRWVFDKAVQILQLNDEVFRYVEQDPLRGRMRLGIPSEFASILLPSIIGEFSALYPDVSLEVTSALSYELLSDEKRDAFDVVLALANSQVAKLADYAVKDDVVWIGDTAVKPSKQAISLVLAPEGCVYRTRVIERLKSQTVPWRIAYTNADLSGLNAAITQGIGITALARRSVPANLSVISGRHLPHLGNIHVCLFDRAKHREQRNQSTISATLVKFIAGRLPTA
ncbi:LysR family transcriptional regulator [Alteromonas oceanisediminis]|uniref:LysR family transcriptional regulator n=1 Tax=Alteromonas oceanisediminis TaxID=2836180 RepID=UPI001BD9C842|nr:LysR family transcriptional regulator [Alteromonas oceanisediminis]MBT0585575.1 LysR family transcriptional regulator [Alteromonas oceanisediminis]